jgi:hypothetical protein
MIQRTGRVGQAGPWARGARGKGSAADAATPPASMILRRIGRSPHPVPRIVERG